MAPLPFSFPGFRGVTRILVIANLFAYFAVLAARAFHGITGLNETLLLALHPEALAHGALWQAFTYSFVHFGIGSTFFELLSLWFLLGFLEDLHPPGWVFGLYCTSVLGTAASAVVIFGLSHQIIDNLGAPLLLYGCFGGLFGLLAVIGTLHGETEFLLFFTFGLKARYMAAIYVLIAIAMLFGQQQLYAFAELGGGVAGMFYVWMAPRRGFAYWFSERWYGLINRYYRWKRRRAGRKFEVYMSKQGKTVHLDGYGKPVDDNPRDRKHWN